MDKLKFAAALTAALTIFSNVSLSAVTSAEANAGIWKSYEAAFAYEKAGKYDLALTEYQNFIAYADYLQTHEAHLGHDHWENIKGISAIVNHLSLSPELYVEAENPADAVYHGELYEPESGAFFGKCDSYDENETAFLLYVQFGTESVKGFDYMIPDNKDIYLEIAWNLPNENKADLDKITSGKMDTYIINNLKYIATLDQKVLLRFGAEVNCWMLPDPGPQRTAFIASYKKAFRRVADLARKHAPNVAMVYAPNDISNWYYTVEDFYPGDEYVDWIGVSMYMNKTTAATYEKASTGEAYYCMGYYDNAMAKIKNVVDAFGDRKPIFISECGFAYKGINGLQTEAHAVEQMEKFYTYVTMVYPEIKGVMFFNAADWENSYNLSGSKKLSNMYKSVTKSNISFGALKTGDTVGYTRFTTLDEKIDTLKLHAFAEYPSEHETTVSYKLDGKTLKHKGDLSSTLTIDVSKLSEGAHKLTMTVKNGSYTKTTAYTFYVGEDNYVTFDASGITKQRLTSLADAIEEKAEAPKKLTKQEKSDAKSFMEEALSLIGGAQPEK